ncbi:MAG: TldD/PmbA family protein [Spirochaetia bacterium]|jgi:TldD protein|nr:TldD/PmbA family protein [Spirochaetia bacterium]
MFNFPENLYVDVRIEETFETKINFKKLVLQEQKVRNNKGAFVRVYDGNRWYYASTTDIEAIQDQIDALANMATPNLEIDDNPIVRQFEVHKDNLIQYNQGSISEVPISKKVGILERYLKLIKDKTIVHHSSNYVDSWIIKSIYSSKGTALTFDKQTCGISINLDLSDGENKNQTSVSKAGILFDNLLELEEFFENEFEKDIDFIKNAKPVEPGIYTVLLSPLAAGVFTHESFGHKSESDFMVGDETMKAEWAIGKTVGTPVLTIIDDGQVLGNGYVPYDDEGTKGKKTYIITDGILTGRLHSTNTSALLEEQLTGNARAINFEFEPIVRMTTTYIEKGNRPLSDIISEIEKGIYIEDIKHGSGMSTFTIAPSRAYKIENGKITTPVTISVVTGNVFETLGDVDAVSEEFELLSFVGGGCGKMEQYPLPVGFGGPYTRVKKLNVQ